MRAGILFMLVVLVFLTLAGAVVARTMGLFDKHQQVAAPAQPQVIAALRRLPEGVAIDSHFVEVRAMSATELQVFKQEPDSFFPPSLWSVAQRITARAIEAGEVIRRKDVVDTNPDRLRERLAPGMRPVTVSLPAEQCQGGQISMGDWVDVSLTTGVSDGTPGAEPAARTAVIARGVRVIMKRDTTLPLFRPENKGEPIPFTLEANPYRAALINFTTLKGQLTLSALPESDYQSLETAREKRLEDSSKLPGAAVDWTAQGVADQEIAKIKQVVEDHYSIGDADLEEIFGLSPIVVADSAPPIRIQKIVGVEFQDDQLFDRPASSSDASRKGVRRHYRFDPPATKSNDNSAAPRGTVTEQLRRQQEITARTKSSTN